MATKGKQVTGQPVLQLKISGPGVRPGRITIPDLIRICEQVQTAVNRQAEALEGQASLRPGPVTAKTKVECTLELIGVRKGSTVLPLDTAKPQLHLPNSAMLGSQAVFELASGVESLATGKHRQLDPGVLDSLNTLGMVFERNAINRIDFIVPKSGSNGSKKRAIRAAFTPEVRERVLAQIKNPTERIASAEGVLEMADFKPGDHRCRINTPLGAPILGLFSDAMESAVQENLRRAVRVQGMASINPHSGRIETMQISEIEPIQSFSVGRDEFFTARSFAELIAIQEVKPLTSISTLAGVFSQSESLDEMLDEIYRERR